MKTHKKIPKNVGQNARTIQKDTWRSSGEE